MTHESGKTLETPESVEIDTSNEYEDESCPYCGGVVEAVDLYDDEEMFTRYECQGCGYRWRDSDEDFDYYG